MFFLLRKFCVKLTDETTILYDFNHIDKNNGSKKGMPFPGWYDSGLMRL